MYVSVYVYFQVPVCYYSFHLEKGEGFKQTNKPIDTDNNSLLITRDKEGCEEVEESKGEINGDGKIHDLR